MLHRVLYTCHIYSEKNHYLFHEKKIICLNASHMFSTVFLILNLSVYDSTYFPNTSFICDTFFIYTFNCFESVYLNVV